MNGSLLAAPLRASMAFGVEILSLSEDRVQLFVLRHHFLCLRVALDQQLIGREQRAVGFGPLRSVRTAPRLLDL